MMFFNKLTNIILTFVATKLFKSRTYVIYTDGTKYLMRTYLKLPTDLLPFEILLHKFYAPDEDRYLHNHPWKKSYSLILAGGYLEERLQRKGVRHYELKTGKIYTPLIPPDKYKQYTVGNVNVICEDDYHMIKEFVDSNKHTWTLFIAGKRNDKGWGFWNPETESHIPWKDYTELNNNVVKDLDGNVAKLPF